jgi:hypothetical protein
MGRAAHPQQEASAAPLRVPEGLQQTSQRLESVSHPSALKRRRVCQGVATVPDVCTSLFALPAVCLAVYRARQPLACGCGWGELPVGTQARCGEAPVGRLA